MNENKIIIDADLELTNHFINGLKRIDLCFEDMNNYKYCGGDSDEHLNYWNLTNKDGIKQPPRTQYCVCGHNIEQNCYIKLKEKGLKSSSTGKELPSILVLGNYCIEKFCPNSGRTCEQCGKSHKNRKVDRCNDCRIGICDECGGKCTEKYKVCYKCKNGLPKNNNFTQLKFTFVRCECCKNKPIVYSECCNCGEKVDSMVGMCDKCNSEIDFGIISCQYCGEELKYSTQDIKSYKETITLNGLKINICIECGKSLKDNKFNKCFDCNNKDKTNKCMKCSKSIQSKYKYCYNCK